MRAEKDKVSTYNKLISVRKRVQKMVRGSEKSWQRVVLSPLS